MNSAVLDTIVATFAATIDGGFVALSAFSLGLLSVCGIIYFYTHMPQFVMGGAHLGDAVAGMFWAVLRIGIFYWLIYILYNLTLAALLTFIQWGIAGAGGQGLSVSDMLSPSTIIDQGFRSAYVMQQFIDQYGSGFGGALNRAVHFWTIDTYLVIYWLIVLGFVAVAITMVIALIEAKLAIMSSAVLLPWGVLTQLAFLSELSIAWLTGTMIRMMLTSAIIGIGIPLFQSDLFKPNTTPGGDPTQYSSITLMIAAWLFAILAWEIPKRAAHIGGRGMALAMGGDAVMLPSYTGLRMAMRGSSAVGQAALGAGRTAVSLFQSARNTSGDGSRYIT